jgi:prepilin-type N-terminal cleavage/methylation domain-containing protein
MTVSMARLFASLRRVAQDERGFTLPELLTSILIFGFLMAGMLGLLSSGARHAPREQERSLAITEAQVGLGKMVRELRQAYKIESAGNNWIQADVRRLSTNTNILVEYDCGNAVTGKCVRRQTTIGGTLPAQGVTVIPRILNSATTGANAVFTYSDPIYPLSLYVTVRLEVPSAGQLQRTGHSHKIVYEDGFYLRNLNN